LQQAITATGAEQVWVTHGYTAVLARWLQERGIDAVALQTRFEGEAASAGATEADEFIDSEEQQPDS
jgi:putative mRNA 3-end processing factor